jgi:hypothetical protein
LADGSDGNGDGNTGRRTRMIAITERRIDLVQSWITLAKIELIKIRLPGQCGPARPSVGPLAPVIKGRQRSLADT